MFKSMMKSPSKNSNKIPNSSFEILKVLFSEFSKFLIFLTYIWKFQVLMTIIDDFYL